jgi:hypothetical protein
MRGNGVISMYFFPQLAIMEMILPPWRVLMWGSGMTCFRYCVFSLIDKEVKSKKNELFVGSKSGGIK